MSSYDEFRKSTRLRVLGALIAALVVAVAYWLAGPPPPGF